VPFGLELSATYRQTFQHLKPGGYIEIADAEPAADAIHVPNAPENSYGSIFFIAAMRSAADGDHLHPQPLTSVGFEEVRTSEMIV
jgi:hypothetical protein